jgi:hypothetical protein
MKVAQVIPALSAIGGSVEPYIRAMSVKIFTNRSK